MVGPFGGPSHGCHRFKSNLARWNSNDAALDIRSNGVVGTLIEEAGIVIVCGAAYDLDVHWICTCSELQFVYKVFTLDGSNHVVVKGASGNSVSGHDQTVIKR